MWLLAMAAAAAAIAIAIARYLPKRDSPLRSAPSIPALALRMNFTTPRRRRTGLRAVVTLL